MINKNMIYPFAYSEKNLILPDVTVIPKDVASNFNIVKSDNVLFPEAANNLEAAKELKEVLSKIQIYSKDPKYSCSLDSVNRFGVKKGTEKIVELILNKYVEICREMEDKRLGFGPGIQYNFLGLSPEGIEVTLGNYGTFAATLLKAAENPDYKKFLIEQGEKLLGNRQAFFVNPPATNAICETKDGYILIANRGPTAEYDNMYHAIAAGHHDPEKLSDKGKEIPLENLIVHQIDKEVGLSREDLKEFKFNGIAFSAGYDKNIFGTEKVEVLTYAKIDKTVDEIVESIERNPEHRWETRQLLVVPKQNVSYLIKETSDSKKPVGSIPGLKKYFSDVKPGTDPNSKSYWVPVGLANLIAWTRINPYILD
ncbi:MAG: hypothetical protein KKF74_00390 [Nanoarchaeota archaeon]|nr:hypothetical protein [Nanoarchaeota archaeon]